MLLCHSCRACLSTVMHGMLAANQCLKVNVKCHCKTQPRAGLAQAVIPRKFRTQDKEQEIKQT